MRSPEYILVDARCLMVEDPDDVDNDNDVYLVKFLDDAIKSGLNVVILTTGESRAVAEKALDIAAQYALETYDFDVDFDLLREGLYTYEAYHNLREQDRVHETTRDAVKPRPHNLDEDIALVIGPNKYEADFAPMVGSYGAYMWHEKINNVGAFDDFNARQDNDLTRHRHIEKSAADSASKQLTTILNQITVYRELTDDELGDTELEAIGSARTHILPEAITRNEHLKDFMHGQPLSVEMPKGKKTISEAEFLLSCYFANAIRMKYKDDRLSIEQEYALEQEQVILTERIINMRGGEDALAEMDTVAIDLLYTPRQPRATR